jgi:CHAT domain-containing protein/tetratricopeptide (TPR) repeat protein
LIEYSTEVNVSGGKPRSMTRELRAGIYVVEIRERDIDLRIAVDAFDLHTELADAHQRHGVHRTVVSLERAGPMRLTLASVDQRSWRGAAAIRILRWPRPAANAKLDERLQGYMALGKGGALIAKADPASWRAAIQMLRQAAAHFETANDIQALAEAEYQRGYAELDLVQEYEDGRRTAESAQRHFEAVADRTGATRAALLRALHEFKIAAAMGPEVARAEQRAWLDDAVARVKRAQSYFDANDMHSDALNALTASGLRALLLGEDQSADSIYRAVRARAMTRGDKSFEVRATQHLATLAMRQGRVSRSVAMFDALLPFIERDRNPDLYATLLTNLGLGLIALGEFDRAQLLHTEALQIYSERGDDNQTARSLAALASIRMASGDLERALAAIESALPLYERARDNAGYVWSLRLAGNAAAQLGEHTTALDYLRRAERRDRNGVSTERTQVLIAGELRELGDLSAADRLLGQVLLTKNDRTRADALAERARLRERQDRQSDALADLRSADALYAHLDLDLNRIDTSAALALALLAAGDVQGAGIAADTSIEIETRIRTKSTNPALRARFLSASYAPYEARIETYLAAAPPSDLAANWAAFRLAETVRAQSLAGRLAGGHPAEPPHDAGADRLHEHIRGLELDIEHHLHSGADQDRMLERRRTIDEFQARLDAHLLSKVGLPASRQSGIAKSREEVQAALPADTAVLAFFVGDHRSHAWALTRRELRHGTLPGRRALEDMVHAFVEQQRVGAKIADSAVVSVFGDLLDGVDAKRLLLLPDGPLNGLPFAALPMRHGEAHELLIDRFVISTAPSLTLAMHAAARRQAKHLRVAVISDPVYEPDDRRLTAAANHATNFRGADGIAERLARLPYSAIEARAVVDAFADAEITELAGFDATARRVSELKSYDLDVLHFATHAAARRDVPEQSALFLSEYAADGSQLSSSRLTLDDIARSGLSADVVVLSGCATGVGRELRGEGVVGLAYGFLANGSRSVIVSLWPVEDALTARFMREFYAAYRLTGRPADALRVAQLRTRGTRGSAVWSSFVVRANALP